MEIMTGVKIWESLEICKLYGNGTILITGVRYLERFLALFLVVFL